MVSRMGRGSALAAFARQFRSPLVLILIFAAVVSAFVGEGSEAVIIGIIVLASCVLSFTQEYGASRAMEALTARIARFLSKRNYRKKLRQGIDPTQIADVSPDAVQAELDRYGVTRLIHGHTHRPATHIIEGASGPCERIVLADWRDTGEALEVLTDGTCRRHVLT